MNAPRCAAVLAFALASVGTVCSCAAVEGGAHEGEAVSTVLHDTRVDVGTLELSPRLGPAGLDVPRGELPSRTAISAASAQLAAPVDALPRDTGWRIINGICTASDAYSLITGTPQDWVNYALTRDDSIVSYRVQAQQLANQLAAADSSGDVVRILGQAQLCWVAGHQSD